MKTNLITMNITVYRYLLKEYFESKHKVLWEDMLDLSQVTGRQIRCCTNYYLAIQAPLNFHVELTSPNNIRGIAK